MKIPKLCFLTCLTITVFLLCRGLVFAQELKGCPDDSIVFINPSPTDKCPVCGISLESIKKLPFADSLSKTGERRIMFIVYKDPQSDKKSFDEREGWKRSEAEFNYKCVPEGNPDGREKILSLVQIDCPKGLVGKPVVDRRKELENELEESKLKFFEDLKQAGISDNEEMEEMYNQMKEGLIKSEVKNEETQIEEDAPQD